MAPDKNLENEPRGVPSELGGRRVHWAVDVSVGVDGLDLVTRHDRNLIIT